MKDPLAIYLHDHLAGASYALDLVGALERNNADTDLGHFAAQLRREIQTDKDQLHEIAVRFGPASDPFKDGAAWLAEKISRMKLKQEEPGGLGTFEALEFLILGIHGKLALWRMLANIAPLREALEDIDFNRLIARATSQEQLVEEYRILLGGSALTIQAEGEVLGELRNPAGPARASRKVRELGVTDEAGHDLENPS